MSKIEPKNVSAQLTYRARGNPPSTLPQSAISNCFPGLEFDFRNVWRRIFAGLVMHEARPQVVDVEEDAPEELQELVGDYLVSVDGQQLFAAVTGPEDAGGPVDSLGSSNLEWANALAAIIQNAGGQVQGAFFDLDTRQTTQVLLQVRRVFADEGTPEGESGVLARELAEPGELTQSLCSPWQNDYRECACYYWAASRPDFVNSEADESGQTVGHNWLHKDRTPETPKSYSLRQSDLVSYEDLFRNWEQLRFIVGGKDEE